MGVADEGNEQAARWNGRAGEAWVETQDLIDPMFKPLETLLVDAVAAHSPGRVLDVGCGTGTTTLAIARRLGPSGHVVGIDVSEPMLTAARARAAREGIAADFVRADAQTYAFAPATFDMIVSRFGVMFFDDPVRAFANLRRAATDNGSLRLIAWRSAADNPFMTAAERAAAPLLPNLPARDPDAPGQFAFADAERVRSILQSSGWTSIDIDALDVDCAFPAQELVRYVTRLGPVGSILHDVDDATRTRVVDTLRRAFEPYVQADAVHFTAACWTIGALA